MSFLRFFGSKKFLLHLAGVVVMIFIVIWIAFIALNRYTRHGDYLTVPFLRGMTLDQVRNGDLYSDFQFVVLDSVYDPGKPKGTIIHQDPYPDSKVKKNRKIYLTIVSLIPEKTTMPELKNMTLRQATGTLESIGLKVGSITYVPAFDEDAIQQQNFDGHVIEAGTKLDKGSTIDLVVGLGNRNISRIQAEDLPDADSMLF
jgi:beta-lactam-binding protein with PASTA domain